MPRALWSGAISFGLVNAPVRMYTAISEHNVHFNMLRAKDAERIHYRKVAGSSGREVPDDQIVKGYEISDGEYVMLTDDEIAAAHVEGDKVIEIHDFVPLEEIDPLVLRADVLPRPGRRRRAGLLAVREGARVVRPRRHRELRVPRPRPARRLREKDGALLLYRMYFADEIRDGDGILPDRKRSVDKRELKLATDLIERMKGTFDHSGLPRPLSRPADGDHREEAQGRDDHGAQGRGAEGARRISWRRSRPASRTRSGAARRRRPPPRSRREAGAARHRRSRPAKTTRKKAAKPTALMLVGRRGAIVHPLLAHG